MLAEKFKATTGHNANVIIPGGVDKSKLSDKVVDRTIDIAGVGALTPLKNYSLFVDIIAELRKEMEHVKVCIIGKGEQEQMLKEKVKKLGLAENIEFAGEVPHSEVFSYLGKSKLFLHTSSYEGQSTVIAEALAMGLTVVCFNVGRLHAEGKVIVCADKDEMVMQLKKLLTSKPDYKPAISRTC